VVGRGRDSLSTDEFWELVSLTGGRVDNEALAPLREALHTLSERQMTRFGDHFRAALAALDTAEHLRQPVRDVDDPPGSVLPMTGGDAFLYARCAVVGAGRSAWESVVAEPPAFAARPWQMADGELLLALVESAYDERTGERFELEPVDLELPGWLHTGYGLDINVRDPAPSRWAGLTLDEALNADPSWCAWWAGTGRPALWLYPFVTPHPNDTVRVRRRKKSVDVEVELSSAWRQGDDPQELAERAVRELQDMIELAAEHLRLPPHPPWPEIGAVPGDLSAYEPDVGDSDLIADAEHAMREAFALMGMDQKDVDAIMAEMDFGRP
jgi:hypothetical protein